MIRLILCDFSWTLLHPKDRTYTGSINGLNKKLGGENSMGDYPFFDHFVLNHALFNQIKALKNTHTLKTCLFTTDIIQERPEVKGVITEVFDRVISGHDLVRANLGAAQDLGKIKTEPNVYQYIVSLFDVNPGETIFIDDAQSNLDAAVKIGVIPLLYPKLETMEQSNEIVVMRLRKLFS